METFNNFNVDNNNVLSWVQTKELTEEELKTIETIKRCLEIFNLSNTDNIALDLLTKLKAKHISLEEVPYEIELIGQTDGNNTIEKMAYKLNLVFLRCLALKSTYFTSVVEGKFQESKKKHLELSNISAEEFEMLIQNIFQPALDENNISALLEISNRFTFSELNKNCEDWLFDILIEEDLPNFMQHLAEHNSPQMLNILAKIAPKHLTELARTSKNDFITLAKLCVEKNLEIKELDLSDSKIDKECLEAIPSTLESLNLSNTLIKDDDLVSLKKFTTLKNLNLSNCFKITDLSLKNLGSLKNLQHLNLFCCNEITDTGLKNLESLTNLQHLDFFGCFGITDEGLKNLMFLKNLQHLNLYGCLKITDKGLKNLEFFTNLQHLDLSQCNEITDTGLKNLVFLKNLQHLNLYGCLKITDEGLKNLEFLTNLQYLNLSWCKKVTDAGLKNLKSLTNFHYLNLDRYEDDPDL